MSSDSPQNMCRWLWGDPSWKYNRHYIERGQQKIHRGHDTITGHIYSQF